MLLTISIIVLVLVIYAVFIRKRLRKSENPWVKWWFALIEPIERRLYLKSESILMARLLMFVGALSTFLTQIGSIDITPLMPLVPDEWEPTLKVVWNMLPMVVTMLGWMQEQLRKDTTKPIEVVALPEAAKADPVVAEVVAKVEEAVAVAKSTAADVTAAPPPPERPPPTGSGDK